MPYAQNVEQHHKTMYRDNVVMVAQQMKNPLIGAVTVVPATGEAIRAADLIGKKRYLRGEARSRRNPENPATGVARWLVFPEQPIESGQYIDKEDRFKLAMDPTSNFMKADVAAVTRGYADTVMGLDEVMDGTYTVSGGGILGIAREGKTPGVGTALPAGQVIAAGGTGLTLDKLRMARKMLKIADFGIDAQLDPLYGAITPEQEDNLLGIAAASGTNLNTFEIEQLKSGVPTKLLGMTWIVTNRLPKTASTRSCAIWAKNNIIVGEWEAINGAMWNDTSAKNLPYIYTSCRIDAVRVEDKGVVQIDCVEP
jgi:hypothetical protein